MPEKIIENTAPLQVGTRVSILEAAKKAAGAADADKKLLEMLQMRHPAYDANIIQWHASGDVALGRITTDADKTRYLIQGDVEENEHFKQRVSLSAFLAETPGLLSDFVGAVFSKPARREFKQAEEDAAPSETVANQQLQERIQGFINEAGPEGQPLTRIAEMAARDVLVFGSVDGVLDHPPADKEEGGTPFPQLILYTPEQRLDWQEGDDGNFLWVKYWERDFIQVDMNEPRIVVDTYRIFVAPIDGKPGTIWPFQVIDPTGKPKIIEFPVITHAFPSIPVRTLYWRKLLGGIGEVWVKPLVEGDVKAFRQESDVTWDIFVHAHPWILAWLHITKSNQQPLNDIKLGQQWAQHLNPGNEELQKEDMQYLAPNTAELSLQMDSAKETRELVRQLAGNGSDMQKIAGQPESGVALAYRQAQRAKNFIQLARGLQEWEWQILELVANEGRENFMDLKAALEVKYPDKFDQRLVEELHQDLQSAKETGSETLLKEIRKELAIKLLGDGATQDVIETVQEEIEEAPTAVAEVEPGEEDKEGEEPRTPQAGASPQPEDETVSFNELTLAIERFVRMGDIELLNELRAEIAKRLGQPPPTPLTEESILRSKTKVEDTEQE